MYTSIVRLTNLRSTRMCRSGSLDRQSSQIQFISKNNN